MFPPMPNGWPGMPPMPYGAPPPPGWYPPPGRGFPQQGPFPPYGYPPGPPGPPGQFQPHGPPPHPGQMHKPAPIGPGAKQPSPPVESQKQGEQSSVKPAEMPAAAVEKAVSPPVDSKPTETKSPLEQPSSSQTPVASKPAPTGPKGRIQPALPLKSPPVPVKPVDQAKSAKDTPPTQINTDTTLRDATQAATAAVAAAMAKLPGQTNGNAVDNLTKKVNEMRTTDPIRAPRHPGAPGAGFNQTRGGRGGRGGIRGAHAPKAEVPATDFDFESANAKFSKEDLVKEVIAGSPVGEHAPSIPSEPAPTAVYNKSTSFFDNISSDSRDRAEAAEGNSRPGGREWRGEEQKKNVETFGQGSVDNGYRGGFRGRGRGRGRGFRGRGYGGNGGLPRGGYRGGNDAQPAGQ